MVICAAFVCGNSTESQKAIERETISFYQLLADENLKPKWIKVIWGGYEAKKTKNANWQIKKPRNLMDEFLLQPIE